ncbi:hypothetical protein C5167_031091 [Papaver somniferum]|nr:hypothetical protein C5167_031091 [Papaver somniferum]
MDTTQRRLPIDYFDYKWRIIGVPHYPDAECDYGIIRDILQLLLLLGNPMMLRLEPVMLVVLPYLTIFLTLQDATPSGSSIQGILSFCDMMKVL